MSKDKKPKEIDLLELFQIAGKGVVNFLIWIARIIIFVITFGIKKAHWLVLFAFIGIGVGWWYHSISKSYFSSGMIIETHGIASGDLIDYMNDLSTICYSRNVESLASALDISESSAGKIKMIEAYPYIDVNRDGKGDFVDFNNVYNPKDTNQSIIQNRCYLQMELFDNQPKEYLQKGLMNYVVKNPYLVQLNQIRKLALLEQITETEKEIHKLDSLQNIEYFSESANRVIPVSTGGNIVYTEKEKRMYFEDKLSLILNKQYLEKEYKFVQEPITIVKNLSELAKEENPKSRVMFRFGILFGLVGYAILLFISYYNLIIKTINIKVK